MFQECVRPQAGTRVAAPTSCWSELTAASDRTLQNCPGQGRGDQELIEFRCQKICFSDCKKFILSLSVLNSKTEIETQVCHLCKCTLEILQSNLSGHGFPL